MSKQAEHTPGPWEWDGPVWDYDSREEAPWLIQSGAGTGVILTGDIQCGKEANARLIAAAPDLLEVAKIALLYAVSTGNDLLANMAGSAITKVEGEQQ